MECDGLLINTLLAVIVGGIVTYFVNRSIESLRKTHQQQLDDRKFKNQIKLASLNQRLEAHQKAYVLWQKMLSSNNRDTVERTSRDCENWWIENNLYLTEKVRYAFYHAYIIALPLFDLKNQTSENKDMDTLKEWGTQITSVGLTIQKEFGFSDNLLTDDNVSVFNPVPKK